MIRHDPALQNDRQWTISERLHALAFEVEAVEQTMGEVVLATWALADRLGFYLRARRTRSAIIRSELLADPAWDILLDLLLCELEQRPVSISSACIAAAVPPTTALRWVGMLEREGVIVRVADSHDRRRSYLRLGDPTRTALLDWAARYLPHPPSG